MKSSYTSVMILLAAAGVAMKLAIPKSQTFSTIDAWLESQSLNEYGDPTDTAYFGGSPLFDETTGKTKDRYEYLVEKFPNEPWLKLDDKLGTIDAWLESQSLNEYGDEKGTMYGLSPLSDETTGMIKDRYEYLVEKFPNEPWLTSDDKLSSMVDAWLKMKNRYEILLEKNPKKPWLTSDDKLGTINAWLESQSLNEYGDKKGTMYAGLSPLFDGTTGKTKDRYEYLVEKFPNRPWLTSDDKLAVMVDAWLESKSLNEYGDKRGTMYAGLSPLFDGTTGKTKDRYEYLVEKFPHQPWFGHGEHDLPADGDVAQD